MSKNTSYSLVNEKSIEDFHRRYTVSADGCWLWGGIFHGSYGRFKFNRVSIAAHVFSHIAFIGDYDSAHIVDHLCMNKNCVNPDHLEAVSKSDNVSRKRESLKRKILSEDGRVTDRMRGIRVQSSIKKEKEMVSFSKRLKDGMERARIVMLWGKRIDATGKSRADFCRKYEIDGGQLSHWINGTHGPDWTSIDRVEKALSREGV